MAKHRTVGNGTQQWADRGKCVPIRAVARVQRQRSVPAKAFWRVAKQVRWLATVAGVIVALATLWFAPSDAQTPDETLIEIPGLGEVPLSEFPPEMRPYIRIPGVDYGEPPEEYGDLPPAPFASRPDMPAADLPQDRRQEAPPQERITQPTDPAELFRRSEERKRSRDAMWRRLYEERAYPNEKIPDDAYQKAWEYIQHMQQAVPPVTPTPQAQDPHAAVPRLTDWLASIRELFLPRQAHAQSPPTYSWSQIGPAKIIKQNGIANAGLIERSPPIPRTPQPRST